MGRRSLNKLSYAVTVSMTLVGLMCLIKLVEVALGISFGNYGIRPRNLHGLIGIVFAPLLHANVAHLAANAVPLLVLLILLFWDRQYKPGWTLALIWVASGLGTWLIGRGGEPGYPTVHIGASSVIYGLVVYLLVAGWRVGSWRSALVAILVFFAYGGIFYGMLPQSGPISWEGHLSGAIAGFWAACRLHR